MPIYNLPSANLSNGSNGIEQLVIYEAQQIPALIPGLLFFIFLAIGLGGYLSQERRTGRGNMPMWFTIAGFITTSASFILLMYNGLINLEVVILSMVITIGFALWFMLSPDEP